MATLSKSKTGARGAAARKILLAAQQERVVRIRPRKGETRLMTFTTQGRKKGGLRAGIFGDAYRARPFERIEIIKRGVAPATVDDIASAMGAGQETVMRRLGIAKSTLARKRQQGTPLEKDASELVMGLATLIGQVETLVSEQGVTEGFDAAKWFHKWAEEPVPALGGKKPAELLDTKEGQHVVAGLLEAIRAGAYL